MASREALIPDWRRPISQPRDSNAASKLAPGGPENIAKALRHGRARLIEVQKFYLDFRYAGYFATLLLLGVDDGFSGRKGKLK